MKLAAPSATSTCCTETPSAAAAFTVFQPYAIWSSPSSTSTGTGITKVAVVGAMGFCARSTTSGFAPFTTTRYGAGPFSGSNYYSLGTGGGISITGEPNFGPNAATQVGTASGSVIGRALTRDAYSFQ